MQHQLVRLASAAISAVGMAAVFFSACDTAPGLVPLDQQPPVVSDLTVLPETIRAAALPPDRIAGGQAAVDVTAAVTARDPDGTVDRVLTLIDPTYGAQAVLARLVRAEERFAGTVRYTLAADRADVLMIRVFAVDNDSLTSNQVVGQVHFLPDTSSGAE